MSAIHTFESAGRTFSSRNLRQSSPEKLDEIEGSTSPLRSQKNRERRESFVSCASTPFQPNRSKGGSGKNPLLRWQLRRPRTHSSATVGVT